jgi:hypothetical protein
MAREEKYEQRRSREGKGFGNWHLSAPCLFEARMLRAR